MNALLLQQTEQLVESLQNDSLKYIMGNLLKLSIEKDKTIEQLQAKIGELEDRLLQQERYTSKDCLVFENLPMNHCDKLDIQVQNFLRQYLNYTVPLKNMKAGHLLRSWKNSKYPPPPRSYRKIHLGEKDEIYARRSMLGKFFNPEKSRPIIIKERLRQKDRELKQMAEKGLHYNKELSGKGVL